MIDPGHGGADMGASRGSFIESKIVLEIAEKIKKIFDKPENNQGGIKIYLTRDSTEGLSLEKRVAYAQQLNADLFLSLHANSSSSTQVAGMEYYFGSPQSTARALKTNSKFSSQTRDEIIDNIKNDLIHFGKTKQSLEFSKKIQDSAKRLKSKIRRAPFYVIENTTMPAVLVEVGFISNQREARKLITPDYQEELAHALSNAIYDYEAQLKEWQISTL